MKNNVGNKTQSFQGQGSDTKTGKEDKGRREENPEKLDALISVAELGQELPVLPCTLSINGQEVQSFFHRERELIHIPFNLKCLLGNSRILFKSIPLVLFVKIICHFKISKTNDC